VRIDGLHIAGQHAEPRSDDRAAEHADAEALAQGFKAFPAAADDPVEPGEHLAERHGHAVLKAGPAQTHHASELFGLAGEAVFECGHAFQRAARLAVQNDILRRGVDVVGGLAHVDVRIGMDLLVSLVPREQFVGPVGDDLVEVHVDGSAAAAPDVDGKLPFHPAFKDVVAGAGNGAGLICAERADVPVRQRAGLLDFRQRANHGGIVVEGFVRHIEIREGTERLNAVIRPVRQRHFAKGIFFYTHGLGILLKGNEGGTPCTLEHKRLVPHLDGGPEALFPRLGKEKGTEGHILHAEADGVHVNDLVVRFAAGAVADDHSPDLGGDVLILELPGEKHVREARHVAVLDLFPIVDIPLVRR